LTQVDFFTAPQLSVVHPEDYCKQKEFVSVAQYPRGFEPEDDEFGMIVKGDVIEHRLFFLSKSWPWG
jgi:hypothetical protein